MKLSLGKSSKLLTQKKKISESWELDDFMDMIVDSWRGKDISLVEYGEDWVIGTGREDSLAHYYYVPRDKQVSSGQYEYRTTLDDCEKPFKSIFHRIIKSLVVQDKYKYIPSSLQDYIKEL